jgi:hypothetical protein
MKIFKNLIPVVGMLFLLSACGPTLRPFTQDLYDDYSWSDYELKKIQFYLSDDIILRREISAGASEIIEGEIKLIEGRQIEEVVIRRGTPGVFLFSPKKERFAVSFDATSDEKFLIFGPNPKANDRYVLMASEWRRRGGTVTYGGRKWRVDVSDAWATLMIDLEKVNNTSVKKEVATGRKVSSK